LKIAWDRIPAPSTTVFMQKPLSTSTVC